MNTTDFDNLVDASNSKKETLDGLIELIDVMSEFGYTPALDDMYGVELRLAGIDTSKDQVEQLKELVASTEALGTHLAIAIFIEITVELLFKAVELIYEYKSNRQLFNSRNLTISNPDEFDVVLKGKKVKCYDYDTVAEYLRRVIPVVEAIYSLTDIESIDSSVESLVSDLGGTVEDGEIVLPDLNYYSATLSDHGWSADNLKHIHPLMVDALKIAVTVKEHIKLLKNRNDSDVNFNTSEYDNLKKVTTFSIMFISRCIVKHLSIIRKSKITYKENVG